MSTSTRIFVKLHIDAVHSGMVADMGAERWQTLTVLASFMNAKGECYPSQELIAQRLGVSRETANRRIRSLAKYTWEGKRLIETERMRDPTSGAWENVRYTVEPPSGFTIFDGRRDVI